MHVIYDSRKLHWGARAGFMSVIEKWSFDTLLSMRCGHTVMFSTWSSYRLLFVRAIRVRRRMSVIQEYNLCTWCEGRGISL